MSLSWTERYRPKSLNDVKGNSKAIKDLKRWADSWDKGRPKKQPAVILAGEPGTGKTSTALALAMDKGWTVIELNASDARNYETIRRTVTMGVTHDTFSVTGEFIQVSSGGRKLVILDEADNLYERGFGAPGPDGQDMSDRGGKKAIIEALSRTMQPIILIVNDAYALTKGRGAAIKRLCKTIWFDPIEKESIKDALKGITRQEGIMVEEKVLGIIADKADGDLRSAVNDLQSLCIGRKKVDIKDIDVVGYRDPRTKIFGALKTIFKTKSLTMARDAARNVDETPDSMLLWIDENMPLEYTRTQDMIEAYQYLTMADILLKRVYRRQNFGLWAYATELMSGGVAMAKKDINSSPIRYNFPMYLIKMARTKGDRGVRDGLLRKFRSNFHCSTQAAREMSLAMRQLMMRNKRLARRLIDFLKLDESELSFIIGNPEAAARLMEETESMEEIDDEEEIAHLDVYDEEGEEEEKDEEGEEDGDGRDDGAKDGDGEGDGEEKEKQQSSLMDF